MSTKRKAATPTQWRPQPGGIAGIVFSNRASFGRLLDNIYASITVFHGEEAARSMFLRTASRRGRSRGMSRYDDSAALRQIETAMAANPGQALAPVLRQAASLASGQSEAATVQRLRRRWLEMNDKRRLNQADPLSAIFRGLQIVDGAVAQRGNDETTA